MGSLFSNNHQLQIPDAPCMEYVPTFGSFLRQMLVNILYMEGASGDGWVADVITTWGPQLIHAHPALDKFPPNIRQYLR